MLRIGLFILNIVVGMIGWWLTIGICWDGGGPNSICREGGFPFPFLISAAFVPLVSKFASKNISWVDAGIIYVGGSFPANWYIIVPLALKLGLI